LNLFHRYYLLVMNLVTQESGPQKGTDSQTGILKGHPERFCVVVCACEARFDLLQAQKKPGLTEPHCLVRSLATSSQSCAATCCNHSH
jgi:hypothetical protein